MVATASPGQSSLPGSGVARTLGVSLGDKVGVCNGSSIASSTSVWLADRNVSSTTRDRGLEAAGWLRVQQLSDVTSVVSDEAIRTETALGLMMSSRFLRMLLSLRGSYAELMELLLQSPTNSSPSDILPAADTMLC